MLSHAANPLPMPVADDRLEILFNCRDSLQRSHVGLLSINPAQPNDILDLAERPLLSPGELGGFDDCGVSLGNLVQVGESTLLYYLGWNLGVSVPFHNSIGVASFGPDKMLHRMRRSPVLDRSEMDPFSLSYPWVIKQGALWEMWYGSTTRWLPGGNMIHELHRAESNDGLTWHPTQATVIPLAPNETAHSRPCVQRDEAGWHLWFALKTAAGYRIGYAASQDGRAWQRDDAKAGLMPSGSGWDGDEVCYPAVFRMAGKQYLLYCGNAYGRTGFGLALWE